MNVNFLKVVPQRVVFGMILFFMLPGCQNVLQREAGMGRLSEKVVSEMSRARWEAIVGSDYEKAYAMLSPGSRSIISLDEFKIKMGKVSWVSADVRKVDCIQGDVCDVEVEAKYWYHSRQVGKVGGGHHLKEKWRSIDGGWWYVYSDQ